MSELADIAETLRDIAASLGILAGDVTSRQDRERMAALAEHERLTSNAATALARFDRSDAVIVRLGESATQGQRDQNDLNELAANDAEDAVSAFVARHPWIETDGRF